MWCKWGLRCLCKIAKGGEGIIHQKVQLLHIRARLSLLLRRFVFRIAEASAKRVTGDEPQGTMGRVQTAGEARCLLPAFLCAHIDRDVWVRGRKCTVLILGCIIFNLAFNFPFAF